MINKNNPQLGKLRLIIAKPFLGIHPNILTIIGACFAPLFFYFMVKDLYFFALLAYIGSSFDAIDGMVARATNKVSRFGEFLDATFDRMGDGFIIGSFGFSGLVRWELVLTFLVTSFLISYTSARAGEAGKGSVKITEGVMTLQDRRVAIFVSLLVIILLPQQRLLGFPLVELIFIVLIILSLITVLQRMSIAYKKLS